MVAALRGAKALDEFLLPSADCEGGLLFYQRMPPDLDEPIDHFWVRIASQNLSATTQVYAGDEPFHPATLFTDMARQWAGWSGELVWQSLCGELKMRCTRDRRGHIVIGVELRSEQSSSDWRVMASVLTEAGQLETHARRAVSFFGRTR
jgi:hypothetical protein